MCFKGKNENKLKNSLQKSEKYVTIRELVERISNGRKMRMVMDWIKKVTDIIMPLEPLQEEEEEVQSKTEEKVAAQSAGGISAKKVATGGGSMSYTKETSDVGTTSMDGRLYTAYRDTSVSMPTARPSLTVVKPNELTVKIYMPETFDQVVGIADDILNKKAAVVNYENVIESEQRRISDFVNGVCYISDGSVSMISDKIFLYMPAGVEAGEIARVATSMRVR